MASKTALAAAKSNMKKRVTFPFRKLIDGKIKAVGGIFDMSRFDEVHPFYVDAMEKGQGYAKHEVEKEYLRKTFEKADVVSFTDEATGEVLSVIPIFGSYICRSCQPFLATAYALVNPKHRGVGLGTEQLLLSRKLAIDLGYLGGISRTPITSRNLVPVRETGGEFPGIIPYCTPLENKGYIDDIVVLVDFHLEESAPEYYKAAVESHNTPLPPLQKNSDAVQFLFSGAEYEPVEVKTRTNGTIKIRPPRNAEEVFEVEGLWRQSAEKGKGFALDEFTDEGYFNRRFYKKSDILLAENNKGDLVGASLFGPSNLSRATNPILAGLYTAVPDRYSNQGIGASLLSHCLDILKKQGFKGCMSDTFTNNHNMLHLLHKFRFTYRGSIPGCAYVKDHGLADSLLVFREL